ncbi:hypothetical protein DRN73_04535 [Candidatus Pacearchaeota archaeon]|nr:MAG: hypothetical protein DRN73_04535 [Candidatus Pacearchaeota archaeon]
MSFEAIVWYLFLIDSLFANLTVLFWKKWYNKTKFSKIFPISFVWTTFYFILIIWVGCALYRLGILNFTF